MKALVLAILLCLSTALQAAAVKYDTMLQRGVDLYEKGDYEQSIAVLESRLKIATDQNDKKVKWIIYNNLGNDYSATGKTVDALKAYESAISVAEELKDKVGIARATKNIGALYADTKDFDKALIKYNDAEAMAVAIKDTTTIADCANNKGLIFEQQLHYDKALAAYNKAIELYTALGQDDRIAILYNNIGIVYKYLKDYDRSIDYYQKSLAISEKIGSKFLVAANRINIGNVYEMKGDYKNAIALNELGLQTGKEINSQELIIEAYSSLADDYAKSGDYKKGFDLYKNYVTVKDSFISIERSKQIAEMQTRYETEKKEKQIIALEKTRYQMLAIIGIMVLLIIVAWLLYNRQQVKQRVAREKAIQLAEYNERMRIAKDVHDDLGSGLSKISLTANVAEQKALNHGNAAQDIRHIAAMSKDLVDNMRDLIWVLNPENTTLDNLISRMREYSTDYLDGLGIEADIVFPHNVPEMRISRETQRNIFATVKEAIHNCVKHAAATVVGVHATLQDGRLYIVISDNGKGIDMKNLRSGSNGLRNMRQRIESVNGSFEIKNDKGTAIHISVPLAGLESAIMVNAGKNTTNV